MERETGRVERREGRRDGASVVGLRDPEKCGDKRDEARKRTPERDEQRFDSRGGGGAGRGAFTEEKLSCSLVEKSNLVTERLTDRPGHGAFGVSVESRQAVVCYTCEKSATERRFIDQQSNYGGGATVTLI